MQIILQGEPSDGAHDRKQSVEEFMGAVREALLGLPCQFECLVFMASLQNPDARRRFCHTLKFHCDSETVDLVLHKKHREIFEEWLSLPLEDKVADLQAYVPRSARMTSILSGWLIPERRDCLVPRDTVAPAKRLFDSDAEVLLIIFDSKGPR